MQKVEKAFGQDHRCNRILPAFLRDGLRAYFVLSPARFWLFCHRLHNAHCAIGRDTPPLGRQDHTTSPSASHALVSCAISVHRVSIRAFVTTAKRPSCRMRRARLNILIWVGAVKSNLENQNSFMARILPFDLTEQRQATQATQSVRTLRALAAAAEGDGHALRQRLRYREARSCRRGSCKARRDAPRHQGRGGARAGAEPVRRTRMILEAPTSTGTSRSCRAAYVGLGRDC